MGQREINKLQEQRRMESSAQKEQNKIDQKRADRAADKRDKYQLVVHVESFLKG